MKIKIESVFLFIVLFVASISSKAQIKDYIIIDTIGAKNAFVDSVVVFNEARARDDMMKPVDEIEDGHGGGGSGSSGVTYGYTDTSVRPTINSLYKYNTDEVPTTFSISKQKTVGEIPCVSSVSQTGAVNVSVRIDGYADPQNYAPSVSLNYNSLGAYGEMGQGWSISAGSKITRVAKSIYYDGYVDNVKGDDSDAFALDGNRLIYQKTVNGKRYYQSTTGNIKAVLMPYRSVNRTFEVMYPNGDKANYYFDDGDFYISSKTNLAGRTIHYNWINKGNHRVIGSVRYGDGSRGQIEFSYIENNDSDYPRHYENGKLVSRNYLLSEVKCYYFRDLLRTYTISYMKRGMSYLATKIECAGDRCYLNPLYFYYGDNGVVKNYSSSNTQLEYYYNYGNTPDGVRVVRGKFDYGNDNDGLITFPNKISCLRWHKHGTRLRDPEDHTQNQYDGSENIVICAGLQDDLAFSKAKIKTEAGFIDLFTANIDESDSEEIIKVNNLKINDVDSLFFTVYKPSMFGVGKAYKRRYKVCDIYKGDLVPKSINTGDFNGDGIMDVMVTTSSHIYDDYVETKCVIIDLHNDKILYSSSNPFSYYMRLFEINHKGEVNVNGQESYNMSDKLLPIDYNGDGKTDIVIVRDDGTYFYSLDTSGSSWRMVDNGKSTVLKKGDLSDRRFLLGEFNGDGLCDLLVSPVKGNSSSTWKIYSLTGKNELIAHDIVLDRYINDDDRYYAQDINLDGQTDFIYKRGSTLTTRFISNYCAQGTLVSYINANTIIAPVNIQSGNSWYSLMAVHNDGVVDRFRINQDDGKTRLLSGVVNSFGVVSKYEYDMLNSEGSGTYSKGCSADHPFLSYSGDMYVGSSMQVYNNGELVNDRSYTYSDAVMHKQGLGFCGFVNVSWRDRVTDEYEYCTFDPYNFSNLIYSENNTSINEDTYYTNVSSHIVTNYATKKLYTNKTNGITSTTTMSYDKYSNLTSAKVTFSDGNISETTKSYINNVSDSVNIIGLVSGGTKTYIRGNEKATTIDVKIYNSKYQLIQEKNLLNGSLLGGRVYTYDSKGRMASCQIRKYDVDNPNLISRYEYNYWGQLISHTDTFGLKETYYYNDRGLLESITDCRNNRTTIEYDRCDREIRRNHADSTYVNRTFNWSDGEVGSLYYIQTEECGKPLTKVYYDAFGREVRTSTLTLKDKELSVDKVYNKKGLLEKESYPSSSTNKTRWTTYTYDSFDRLTKAEGYNGKVETYSYDGTSRTIVQDNVARTITCNSLGDMVSTSDVTGTIKYTYDALGNLRTMTSPDGYVTRITYDKYGRKVKVEDPSSGIYSIAYNASGNIENIVDARGKKTTFTYDEYNRLKKKNFNNESNVSYYYDQYNQLTAEVGDNYSDSFTFDRYGRLVSDYKVINGGIFSRKYGYDNGVLHSIQYIGNDAYEIGTEVYEYKNGHVAEILFNGETVYRPSSVDNFGRITFYRGAFSLSHSTTYDSENRLTKIYTYNYSTSKDLQKFSYTYDKVTGNLKSRKDEIRSRTEKFTYDELNRLVTFGNERVEYDDNGNILYNSLVGDLSYGSSKPYCVTEVENVNGYIPNSVQELAYNAQGLVSSLKEGTKKATFVYNSSGNRIMMNYTDEANDRASYSKYYFVNKYEFITGTTTNKEILYIGGDAYDAKAVYVRENGGEWCLYDISRDRQGSITLLVDSKKRKVQELSYDAWGNLRDPETWKLYHGDEPQLLIGRGYTGHEHLQEFGLINMNARLYNPLLGRFINPDPYIQELDNSQNFNRYSYCLNNPLKYNDPSGKFFATILNFIKDFVTNTFVNSWTQGINAWTDGDNWHSTKMAFKFDVGMFKGNAWQIFSRFTWEAPQTTLGYCLGTYYTLFDNCKNVTYYDGATCVERYSEGGGAVTLGSFVFGQRGITASPYNWLFQHEYGHYLQSQSYGPLYLFMFGLPSIISASGNGDHRYYPTEQDANIRAFKYFKKHIPGYDKWDFITHPISGYDNSLSLDHVRNQNALNNGLMGFW